MKALLLTLFLLASTSKVWAYPNFIGMGYGSCLTCHYNPFGNGPLTDYGRAVSATAISDRIFHASNKSEDDIAGASGFLYSKKPFLDWLRPSIDYRGLYLIRNQNTENSESELIHMQANGNILIKAGKDDKYVASFTYGYAPTPRSQPDDPDPNFRSREHYVGMRIGEKYGVYVGLMDKVFGIRVPDHTAFSRASNALGQNDQTHGVVLHMTDPKFDIGIHPFVGNLTQQDNVRQKGFSGQFEYSVLQDMRAGASFLTSKSEFVKYTIFALHNRWGFGKGSSLMVEIGQTNKSQIVANSETTSRYLFLQNHIKLRRGLLAFATVEYLKADTDKDSSTFRWGPGIQYFPGQGLELRADIFNSRTFSDAAVSEDNWDIAGQVHLWF